MSTLTDDYGAEFAAHSDSLAYRTIGIYVFLRTVNVFAGSAQVRPANALHCLPLPSRSAKATLDPLGLLNPGVLIDP